MNLRTYFREQVIVVDIGGPHCLIHICHKSDSGLAQYGSGVGGPGEYSYLFIDLIPRAHYSLHVTAGYSGNGPGGFKRAHKSAAAEIFDEIVLV